MHTGYVSPCIARSPSGPEHMHARSADLLPLPRPLGFSMFRPALGHVHAVWHALHCVNKAARPQLVADRVTAKYNTRFEQRCQ
eukprot:15453104-Alexandrium_andersonii.AAC.1